jgi:hypothetical protein
LRDPSNVRLEGRVNRLKPIDPRMERLKRMLAIACCFVVLIAAFAGLVFIARR